MGGNDVTANFGGAKPWARIGKRFGPGFYAAAPEPSLGGAMGAKSPGALSTKTCVPKFVRHVVLGTGALIAAPSWA